jgi:D-galactarolactone cycloisomerase
VRITTDEGITGWGECFGAGQIAIGNKCIVEQIIKPMIVGSDPVDRDVLWHRVYNKLRDHGQKGMPMQALSGVDIALWDIAGKVAGLPVSKLIGGAHRDKIAVYGYGMMLRRESAKELAARFTDEAAGLRDKGFAALKMKVGLGVKDDIRLAEAVRKGVGDDFPFMVDANHCYTTSDALQVGYALDDLEAYWFEEPIAPEDRNGYRELRSRLKTNIAGGEVEFGRWGWLRLLEARGVDIAQPEVCGLGGISEYLRVMALCQAHFTPIINHVWGSAIAVATNLQLLAAQPHMPGGLFPHEPWLEFDTTENRFRDDLLTEPLSIQKQIAENGGLVTIPTKPGLGVEPDEEFIRHYEAA